MVQRIETLILSGGGVRGIAYIGVFEFLEHLQQKRVDEFAEVGETNINSDVEIDIKNVCTVSIGSLLGLLYIIGYTSAELRDELLSKDISRLKNIRINNLVYQYGFDSGDILMNWVESLLIRRGVSKDITFRELFQMSGINYQVICSNVNTYRSVTFDHVGMPNLKVLKAVRMSMSIPLVFTAEKYRGDIYVDGGLTDNYPIRLYDATLPTVLGIKFVSTRTSPDFREDITSFSDYVYNIMFCYSLQKEKYSTIMDKYRERTVYIDADSIAGLVNFDLTDKQKLDLIDMGYFCTSTFFKKNIICFN